MFIVLDAIDGGGKGYQRQQIAQKLIQQGIQVKSQEFPVHDIFYESIIHPALQEETTMNRASWVLSFLLDKTRQAEEITTWTSTPQHIYLADGYFTTTLAYQGYLAKQVDIEKLIEYAEEFEIPKPDLAIYLDVEPEVAMDRKEKEEGHEEGLDMNEKSLEKQKELQEIFRKMVQEQVYCTWEQVDGNGTPEEVTNAIMHVIKKQLQN